MANLLYAEYNKGCNVTWYIDDSGPADYHYGIDASKACYYADLEPNTTYTIQRIDASDRFRVVLTSQDLKYLTATSDTSVQTPFSWGYEADNSLPITPITFTTGSDNIHLVAFYTNTSQYTTRVMLNEGSSIEPYEAPTRYFKNHWRLINGKLINNDLPEPIESNLTPPYPASMWYLDENNKLMNALLPDILPLGAFALTTELQEIRLPESLEEIGPEAFYGSAIRHVTIPNNQCTYYATSFPPGCVVTGGHLIE